MKTLGALALGALLGLAGRAEAQVCSTGNLWNANLTGGAGTASSASNDSGFPGTPANIAVVAQGLNVFAVSNLDSGASSPAWSSPAFGSTVMNYPNPVPTRAGSELVFVGAQDGFLYAFNAVAAGVNPFLWRKDLRRYTGASLTCTVGTGDTIIATPAVQLYQYSDATFKAAAGDDLVFVITRFGCGTLTGNRIYAVRPSDQSILWTFNTSGSFQMDYGSEGCTVDYDTSGSKSGTLYCGTHLPDARFQNTLWAINTSTGVLKWAANIGSMVTRPVVANGRVYAANYNGTLYAFDATTGAPAWNYLVTSAGAHIAKNPWVEFRKGGYGGMILLTDDSGFFHRLTDSGASATRPGPAINLTAGVSTIGAVLPVEGKAFLGTYDGALHQVDLATGNDDAHTAVGTGTVSDPALDVTGGATSPNRVSVAAINGGSNIMKRYCVPWIPGSAAGAAVAACKCTNPNDPSPTACASANCLPGGAGSCWTPLCNSVSGVCFSKPVPNGQVCTVTGSDSTCVLTPTCHSGLCTGNFTQCGCGNRADGAPCGTLASGASCCNGACITPTGSSNCGGCGWDCSTSDGLTASALPRRCFAATCERDKSQFCVSSKQRDTFGDPLPADATQLGQAAIQGSTSITYNLGGNNICSADVTVWNSKTNEHNGDALFDNNAAATTFFDYDISRIEPITSVETDLGPAGSRFFFAMNLKDPALGIPALGFFDPTRSGNCQQMPGKTCATPIANAPKNTTGGPFVDTNFNLGPIGPTFDHNFDNTTGNISLVNYVANWQANGDLYVTKGGGGPSDKCTASCIYGGGTCPQACGWAAAPLKNWNNPGTRILAIQQQDRRFFNGNSWVLESLLYVAHSKTMIRVCLLDYTNFPPEIALNGANPNCTNRDINEFGSDPQDPRLEGFSPIDILSITGEPFYGDLYIEAKDKGDGVAGKSEILVMRSDDFSVHELYDTANVDLKSFGHWISGQVSSASTGNLLCSPSGANCEGRLSGRSRQLLERVVPSIGGTYGNASYADLPVLP